MERQHEQAVEQRPGPAHVQADAVSQVHAGIPEQQRVAVQEGRPEQQRGGDQDGAGSTRPRPVTPAPGARSAVTNGCGADLLATGATRRRKLRKNAIDAVETASRISVPTGSRAASCDRARASPNPARPQPGSRHAEARPTTSIPSANSRPRSSVSSAVQPLKPRVGRQHALRHVERLAEHPEQHRLVADDDQHRGSTAGCGCRASRRTARIGPASSSSIPSSPTPNMRRAGVEEQPARAEQQQEAQVPPAVAPTAQVRRAGPAVLGQRGRHLGDAELLDGRLDHHLARELHAGQVAARGRGWRRGRSRAGRSGSPRDGLP